MNFRGICISSTGGSGGKTIFSLGLARAAKNRGILVKPFKKGPDYIDAAWLSLACDIPATNLDPFFLDKDDLIKLFNESLIKAVSTTQLHTKEIPLAIVEGNRGLFDGLDDKGSCSTAYVARILDLPIILCLDCTKITRTIAAILQGLINFEKNNLFAGIILNKVGSARHENILRSAICSHVDLPILGALPRLNKNPLPERHMGLSTSFYINNEQDLILNELAAFIENNCDVANILNSSKEFDVKENKIKSDINIIISNDELKYKPRIGIIKDDAFWFNYPENLSALVESGAELITLSMLENSNANLEAWQQVDGIYICGGFPEDYVEKLSCSRYLDFLLKYSLKGMPIYAECGGLILCCRFFNYGGRDWPMAGIFPNVASWTTRPIGLGYVGGKIILPNPYFKLGSIIKGHEFHYSKLIKTNEYINNALELYRGQGLFSDPEREKLDALLIRNTWGSFTHIFAPSLPVWSENFVKAAKLFASGKINCIFSVD